MRGPCVQLWAPKRTYMWKAATLCYAPVSMATIPQHPALTIALTSWRQPMWMDQAQAQHLQQISANAVVSAVRTLHALTSPTWRELGVATLAAVTRRLLISR